MFDIIYYQGDLLPHLNFSHHWFENNSKEINILSYICVFIYIILIFLMEEKRILFGKSSFN